MKTLLNGCAAVALLVGFAGQASAQVEARDTSVRVLPVEGKGDIAAVAAVRAAEPEAAPGLSQDETDFFAALGHRVTDAATAYESYVSRATAIDPRFSDAASVRKAVQTGAAYQPEQLQEGMVAYAAMLALRDRDFVDAVREHRDPAYADRLLASPESVLDVRGADQAASAVAEVLRAQGAALLATGRAISQAAYDVQAQPWSKTPVTNPVEVLAATKSAASEPRSASVQSERLLLQSLVSAPQAQTRRSSPVAPEVVRGLALAALAVLGRTGDKDEAALEVLLHDPSSIDCLKMTKLNLNQCLAAAGPHYEDVFCVGRHAVGDTAQCVASAADGVAGQTPQSVGRLRVASRQEYGPDQAADVVGGQAPQSSGRLRVASRQEYGPEQAAAYGYPAPYDPDDQAGAPREPARYAAQPSRDYRSDPGPADSRSYSEQPRYPAAYPPAPRQYYDSPRAAYGYAQDDRDAGPGPDPNYGPYPPRYPDEPRDDSGH